MDASNLNGTPKIKHESKKRIRVEFERTPLKERLKAKFLSLFFLKKFVWWIFRMVLMIGISYIVINPFLTYISGSVMGMEDFVDVTVRLIPKHFSIDIYRAIISELGYWTRLSNTFLLAFSTALIQTFVCCLIGYGFAKFKFKGRSIVFLLVMLTMIIPHKTLQYSMYMEFRYFDIYGLIELFTGKTVNLCDTYWPFLLLSIGGLAFKNGLYIFLLRQFFRGIPDELEESAYMDGSGTFRTFIQIILPLAVPMMITVFLFAFCWQWTDIFYTQLFISDESPLILLSRLSDKSPVSLKAASGGYAGEALFMSAIKNTCGLMIIFPLVILYVFCQRFLVQGIEHSGIAN